MQMVGIEITAPWIETVWLLSFFLALAFRLYSTITKVLGFKPKVCELDSYYLIMIARQKH